MTRVALAALVTTGAIVGCDARTANRGAVPAAHALAAPVQPASPTPPPGRTLRFGAFGTVHVTGAGAAPPATTPAHAVVLAWGDGAWSAVADTVARAIAERGDVLVLGVDARAYLARTMRGRGCAFPAGDVEALSQYAQHQLGLARYTPPVLVGSGVGAALAYATLAQAPRGTFPGAIALGHAQTAVTARPFCGASRRPPLGTRTAAGVALIPDTALALPFVTVPPADGSAGWRTAFTRALDRIAPSAIAAPAAASGAPSRIADLPLVSIAPAATAGGPTDLVAVVISGDGGWASIDREVGETLAAGGVPVVGLNSLQYFWTPRTPDVAGADLARIVEHATATPPGGGAARPRVVLVGYSRGADVLPFMARRLPADLRARIAGVALLGLEPSISFEFHVSDWLGGSASDERPTLPEIAALRAELPRAVPILCFYGTGEDDSACPAAARQSGATAVAMPGGHHLGGDYPALARRILAAVR